MKCPTIAIHCAPALVVSFLFQTTTIAEDWVHYASEKYSFTAKFPVTPKETVKNSIFSLDAQDESPGILYGIDVHPLPALAQGNESVVRGVMTAGRDAILKELDGKLIADCEIRSSGLLGRQFTVKGSKDGLSVVACCRNVVAGGQLYILRVNRNGDAKLGLLSVMQFFGSFQHKASKSEPDGIAFHGVKFGSWAKSDHLQFRVTQVSVERVKVHRTILNDLVWSNNELLVVKMEIRNSDERRIVRMANNVFKTPFGMLDDVQNVIRGVNFGATAKPYGQLSANDDINPESTVKNVVVFNVPPPKTKSLTLVVQLDQFGQKGTLLLDIPAEKIKGFRAEE